MKAFKRNAVVLTVVLFVGAAVYLNWAYGKKEERSALAGAEAAKTDITEEETVGGGGSLFYTANVKKAESEPALEGAAAVSAYFDTVRLSRQQARDAAKETLLTVSGTESGEESAAEEALGSITQMAQWQVLESSLEGEIMAKGFEDCVVFMTDSGVTVTVPAPASGLSQASVARITDVVMEQTDYDATQLRVVEVK